MNVDANSIFFNIRPIYRTKLTEIFFRKVLPFHFCEVTIISDQCHIWATARCHSVVAWNHGSADGMTSHKERTCSRVWPDAYVAPRDCAAPTAQGWFDPVRPEPVGTRFPGPLSPRDTSPAPGIFPRNIHWRPDQSSPYMSERTSNQIWENSDLIHKVGSINSVLGKSWQL